MSIPTTAEIEQWLTEQQHPTDWASALNGLPWTIIRPIAQMAANTKAHPYLALGMVAANTQDEQVRATIDAHLARRDPGPGPNRAQRRAAAKETRRRR